MSAGVNRKSIFIGGFSRTGTTMIQGIICQSPQTIRATRECSYLRSLFTAYKTGLELYDLHTFDYFSKEEYKEFNKNIIGEYLDRIANNLENKVIVQKEPSFTEFFKLVPDLLNNVKFIVMFRDIRDALASQYTRFRRTRTDEFPLTANVQRYVQTYRSIFGQNAVFKGNCAVLRYEDLCTQPKLTIKDIAEFLDLNSEDITADNQYEVARTRRDESYSVLDRLPPKATSIGNFKNILPNQINSIVEKNIDSINNAVGENCFYSDTYLSDSCLIKNPLYII